VRLRAGLVALALAATGCASVTPLQPLSGGTARQAWQELAMRAESGGTLASWSSVRVSTPEGRRSFRATIQLGEDGAVHMSAFTPVGTEVFAFEVRGGTMVFADHSSRRSWRGPFREVAMQLGIPEGLDAADFARLVFGLPPPGGEPDFGDAGNGIVRQGGMSYRVSGLGLTEATRDGTSWRVSWDPGSYPPRTVTFDDDTGRGIVVRHLDVSHSRRSVEPLAVSSAYACCFRPTITSE
jgi:hypothetical protein